MRRGSKAVAVGRRGAAIVLVGARWSGLAGSLCSEPGRQLADLARGRLPAA